MNCPKCGYYESKVVDSRNVDEYNSIRRRRECLKCRNRFTTYEKIEYTPIIVIKKNGIREQFDRDKVIKGMIRACQKRPVTLEQIEKIAEEIEFELNNSLEKEIESSKIGDIVIEKLKQIQKRLYYS